MLMCRTGLFILPYVFGGELFPNRLRSFGGALSQCFHCKSFMPGLRCSSLDFDLLKDCPLGLFFFAMNFAVPSLLSSTDNWGAFLFFAAWCFIAIVYVYFMVPELAGLSVEEVDDVFTGPWFNAHKRSQKSRWARDIERQQGDM